MVGVRTDFAAAELPAIAELCQLILEQGHAPPRGDGSHAEPLGAVDHAAAQSDAVPEGVGPEEVQQGLIRDLSLPSRVARVRAYIACEARMMCYVTYDVYGCQLCQLRKKEDKNTQAGICTQTTLHEHCRGGGGGRRREGVDTNSSVDAWLPPRDKYRV